MTRRGASATTSELPLKVLPPPGRASDEPTELPSTSTITAAHTTGRASRHHPVGQLVHVVVGAWQFREPRGGHLRAAPARAARIPSPRIAAVTSTTALPNSTPSFLRVDTHIGHHLDHALEERHVDQDAGAGRGPVDALLVERRQRRAAHIVAERAVSDEPAPERGHLRAEERRARVEQEQRRAGRRRRRTRRGGTRRRRARARRRSEAKLESAAR